MKNLIVGFVLLAGLALPALAQYGRQGRLPADDQQRFDQYYSKWQNDTRRNDRDDVRSDERHMQDIMSRNGIPPDVPYDRIASGGGYGYGDRDRDRDGDRDRDRDRGDGYGSARLSPQDQQDFDNYYSKWMNDTRRNDRDDIREDERHMQDIMSRNRIPTDVPYDQIATQGRR